MPEVTDHKPMTPSWVDIGTDVDGAKAFYSALFGWDTEDAGPPEQTGGYGFFTKGGKMVAGYGPQQNPGPPFWSAYIAVVDADAVTTRVEAAGGTVIVPPMDVMGAGHMAVFQDPSGAFISVWQAGEHRGAQVVQEPATFSWCELNTRDAPAAAAFYRSVFGWDPLTHDGGPMPYTEFQIDGESIAGMMPMPQQVPAEVPPYWLVYFGTDDVDAGAASAEELGATVLVPVMEYPGGRFAVLADPQGAAFALMQPS
jgi:predicted enzyme related to lactoylglutathione lyase